MEIAHIEDVRRAGVRKVTVADTMTSGNRKRRMHWGSREMVDAAVEVRVEGCKDGREKDRVEEVRDRAEEVKVRVEGGKRGRPEGKGRSKAVSS
jgi:hypothetical protein